MGGRTMASRRIKQIVQECHQIRQSLKTHNLDTTVFEIVEQTMQSRIAKAPSNRELVYWERLTGEMIAGVKGHGSTRIEETLLTFNFNSRLFCLHYISRISKGLVRDSFEQDLDRLSFELKNINQIQLEPGMIYQLDYPSVKEFIGNWITEEIAYLERKVQIDRGFSSSDSTLTKNFKISIDMSVAQLTCFIRGLVERKVILNSNLTDLSKFLSRVIETKRTESFSEGSFRRKYYNIESGTKSSVINILKGTIDWLSQN